MPRHKSSPHPKAARSPKISRAEKDYQLLFHEMQDAFALHELICDGQGRPLDYRFLAVNPAFERMTGLKASQVTGKRVLEILPHTEQHWIDTYGRVVLTGEPVFFENYAQALDKFFEVKAFRPAPGQFVTVFADITMRKKKEELLRESEERFKILAFNTPDFILVQDLDLRYEMVINPPMGLTEEEMIGKKDHDLLSQEDAVKLTTIKQRILTTGKAVHLEIPVMSRKGGLEYFDGSYAPRRDAQGRVNGLIGYFRNVTDRKRTDELLRQAKEHAERESRSKSEFLSNVSHDLRTPLNSIIGFCSLLTHEMDKDKQQRMISIIKDQSRNVLSLINEILDVSRFEAGKIELRQEEFVLESVVALAVASLQVEIGERNIRVDYSPAQQIPRLMGDPIRIGQVLNNLLDNALKYTEEGRITVKVDRIPGDDDKHICRVRVSIKDTGVGIPLKKQPYIFNQFVTAHEFVRGKDVGGSGLGLFISKTFVDLMGGHISFTSEEGKGTEFVFVLGLKISETS